MIVLYVDGTRVDMFKNETINVTSTIQNVKDISKIFTDFSQSFSLPASKVNNKLFKHYYNSDIEGFDARVKYDAILEVNHLPFREGKIKLDGVKLKDNKPYAYKVTFFGGTITLKDLLGSDLLEDLPLTNYDHEYSIDNVLTGLQTCVADNLTSGVIPSNAIIYPLINRSTDYYYYDSTNNGTGATGSRKISWHSVGSSNGIKETDLKAAIRLTDVVDAIESKYGLTFSTDFFENSAFTSLYLWLHRTKEGVGITSTGTLQEALATDFNHVGTGSGGCGAVDFVQWQNNDSEFIAECNRGIYYVTNISIVGTPSGKKYNVKVTDTNSGDILWQTTDATGTTAQTINLISTSGASRTFTPNVLVTSEDSLTSYTATWTITKHDGLTTTCATYLSSETMAQNFIISQNMPKMKVLDFLTGIFKMFNLTAYLDDNTIIVKTLDSFYSGGVNYNVTDFVDVKDKSVDNALPFREIKFGYPEPKTFLAKQFSELNNYTLGNLDYKREVDGEVYEVKIPFEHIMFERLYDDNDAAITNAQYGWFVDEKQEKVLAKPLVFYNVSQSIGSKTMLFNSTQMSTTYNRPSNTKAADEQTLHFNAEIDEYEQGDANEESLFDNYYTSYITDTFKESNRLTKVTAYLPTKILLNYTLADRFIVSDKVYKINSIKTDLSTGKSEIELLNDY